MYKILIFSLGVALSTFAISFLLHLAWRALLPVLYKDRFIPIAVLSPWEVMAFDTKTGTCMDISMTNSSLVSLRPLVVMRVRNTIPMGSPTQMYYLKECLKAYWPDVYEEVFNVNI